MAILGVGIIGTGSIVSTYVQCVNELESTKLIALYTESSERVDQAEQQFKVPVYSNLQQFLNHPEIDFVCVCNKSGLHGNMSIASAKAGKHVLCEKPLEVTTQKVDEVIRTATDNDVILGCVFQNRCTTDYKAVEAVVKAGKLGSLLFGNAHINWYRSEEYYANNPWRGTLQYDGGAALMNQGIHTIDLLLNLMGPVASVFGKMKTMVHDIEGEDVGTGIINFKNGALGTITSSTAFYPGYPERLEVFGEKGSILMEGGKIIQWNVDGVSGPERNDHGKGLSGAADPSSIGHLNHKKVIGDMVEAVKEKRKPMVDGVEARKAVEVITALYESSREERIVLL